MKALNQLLSILTLDSPLTSMLNSTIDDSKVYPVNATSINDSITWRYVPMSDDGIKCKSRFEVRCFSLDLLKAYMILDRVKELLITIGDDKLTESIRKCEVNGGISPIQNEDNGIYYVGAFFYVTYRK